MKVALNRLLDRESLPRTQEGRQIYNDQLALDQQSRKTERRRLRRYRRLFKLRVAQAQLEYLAAARSILAREPGKRDEERVTIILPHMRQH